MYFVVVVTPVVAASLMSTHYAIKIEITNMNKIATQVDFHWFLNTFLFLKNGACLLNERFDNYFICEAWRRQDSQMSQPRVASTTVFYRCTSNTWLTHLWVLPSSGFTYKIIIKPFIKQTGTIFLGIETYSETNGSQLALPFCSCLQFLFWLHNRLTFC